jgi:hypothetical protein
MRIDDLDPFQVTHDPDRKAPPGVPVVQGHQPQTAPVMGGMMDKVVRPEMAGMRRTQEPSVSHNRSLGSCFCGT